MINTTEQWELIIVGVVLLMSLVAYLFCGLTPQQMEFAGGVVLMCIGYLTKSGVRIGAVTKSRIENGQEPNPFKPKNPNGTD